MEQVEKLLVEIFERCEEEMGMLCRQGEPLGACRPIAKAAKAALKLLKKERRK